MPQASFIACKEGHRFYDPSDAFCPDCGNPAIYLCSGGHKLKKDPDPEPLPNFCQDCGERHPWPTRSEVQTFPVDA